MLYQIISIIGALLVLVAFAAQQSRHLHVDSPTYQLMNFFGGLLLCITAIHTVQAGFILMEGAWTLLAARGLWRVTRQRT